MFQLMKRLWSGLSQQGHTITQKTTRGLVWGGVSNICLNLTEVVQTLILVHLLTPLDFGIVRIGIIAASYGRVLTTTGISKALVQSREMSRDLIDTAWVIEIVRNLLQFVALMLLAPLVALYFKQEAVTTMLRIFSLRYVFSAFRNPATQLLIRDMNFRRHEMFERTYNILGFVVTLTAAFFLRNYWALVIGQLFLALADLAGSYIMYPYMPRFHFDRQHARRLIKFGKHLYVSAILGNALTTLDSILLGRILGIEKLGIYSVMKNLAVRPGRFLVGVMEPVLFPALASMQDNLDRIRKSYVRIVGLIALVRMPVYAGMALVAPILLPLLFPSDHPEYLTGIPVFILFCIAAILTIPVNPLLQAIGKPYLTWVRPLIACVFFIPAILLFGTHYGMLGVAAVRPMHMLLFWGIGAIMIRHAIRLQVRDIIRAMARPFLATAVMVAALLPVVLKLAQPTLLWAGVVSIVGAVIYVLLTIAINAPAVAELGTIGGSLLAKTRRTKAKATGVGSATTKR